MPFKENARAAWEGFKQGLDFLQRNRAKWGALLLAVGGYVASLGPEHDAQSKLLLAIGGLLLGAGVSRPDTQVRAQQEWEKSGQPDRRVE